MLGKNSRQKSTNLAPKIMTMPARMLLPQISALHLVFLACLLSCSTSDQEGGTYTIGEESWINNSGRWSSHNNQLGIPGESVKLPGERFETQNNSLVTGQVGASVILHCKTSSATGGLVSWVRKRDYQLLTVGLHTHSSDDRFTINYVHWDWQLHIRYVQPRDAGAYECQVSSHPPTSLFVHLQVVEAEAEILGAPEKHVKLGTMLRLVCIMHHTTEPLSYVFWYRGIEMINYESDDDGGVVVESDDHTSVLMVTKASRHHSGNYTCAPSNTKPASILVHVLNGEHPAAMQHGEASGLVKPPPLLLVIVMALVTQIFFCLPSTPMWQWHHSGIPSKGREAGRENHLQQQKKQKKQQKFGDREHRQQNRAEEDEPLKEEGEGAVFLLFLLPSTSSSSSSSGVRNGGLQDQLWKTRCFPNNRKSRSSWPQCRLRSLHCSPNSGN